MNTWKFWYVVKGYTDDEFDNLHKSKYDWRPCVDHEDVAREVAEDYFHSDPCDPCRFEPVIGVRDALKNTKWFKIRAEPTVNFYADEIELKAE